MNLILNIIGKPIIIALFGAIPLLEASAASPINYLVLKGTGGWGASWYANPVATMTAQITNSCPQPKGIVYYGVANTNYSSAASYSGGTYSGGYSSTSYICVGGVPNTIQLFPAGTSSPSSISLVLGGAAQTLATYNAGTSTASVGVLLPDGSMVAQYMWGSHDSSSGTTYTGSMLGRFFSSSGNAPGPSAGLLGSAPFLVDNNGAVCSPATSANVPNYPTVSAYGICANYIVGY